MKILITGGAGFIGSNFIHMIREKRSDWEIVNFDLLTYAGNLANLEDIIDNKNYRFVKGDISNPGDVKNLFSEKFEYVVNFAAETHVDRSLYDPGLFLKTNVGGTQLLLNEALKSGVLKFLHVSTDEVYGSLGADGSFDETSPLSPNSPYAASKASADLICRSYFKTFDMPVVIARASNNYGPCQFPEKLIPFFITKALTDESLPLYGDGLNIRDWLYVEDCCLGILAVLENGRDGEVYNTGGQCEMTNLEITRMILDILGKPESLIKFVEDRPAHDRRYALDNDKIEKELAWRPKIEFADGLKNTVEWYDGNRKWWEEIISGQYRQFYDLHYKNRQ
jgi:dTDP-glucose 4,6-dehydratase